MRGGRRVLREFKYWLEQWHRTLTYPKAADICLANCSYMETMECDQKRHCASGCCSKFGVCGLGPECEYFLCFHVKCSYQPNDLMIDCGKKNCVSTCDAKSECDPGNWGSKYAQSSSCLLNACCSKSVFSSGRAKNR